MTESLIALDIKQREPIINGEMLAQCPLGKLDKQWQFVTEVIKRELVVDPSIQAALMTINQQRVSETLPAQCITLLSSVNKRVAKIA